MAIRSNPRGRSAPRRESEAPSSERRTSTFPASRPYDAANQPWGEFPTSPVIVGRTLCVTSSDGARRDNFPNAPGEGAKVSCLDEHLPVR